MFVIMAVATDTRAVGEAAAIAIGGTVGLDALVGGPVSGASMNPARSLGPALAAGELTRSGSTCSHRSSAQRSARSPTSFCAGSTQEPQRQGRHLATRSAASCAGCGLDDRKALGRRVGGLPCLHDRAVDAVGDLVREGDADVLEACGLEARLVLADGERAGDAAGEVAALEPLLGVRRSSATTSVIPIRPPGLSTRAISVSTAGLSAERLMTQLEMTTSTESAGSGIASIRPLRKWTLATPASRAFCCASASISSVMSSP